MKKVLLLVAVALCLVSSSFAQEKTVFESADVTKTGSGVACVQLAWKKGAENTAYFLVERSSNGNDFKQIALVFTAEEKGFTDYKFRDKDFAAANSAVYYRIALVNEQKEMTYLPVKKVEVKSAVAQTSLDSQSANAAK